MSVEANKDTGGIPEGLAFDDVLLVPRRSRVLPRDTEISSRFSRNISLRAPIVSAAMDTVTEGRMAIEIAKSGGIGVIHRNMPIESQAEEVRKVKRSESWIVRNPISLSPKATVRDAKTVMLEKGISGIPVTDESGQLLGLVTRRDLVLRESMEIRLEEIMKRELITVGPTVEMEEAKRTLIENGIEKLPVVGSNGELEGLITLRDILKKVEHPDATVDSLGRLRVAAAIGIGAHWRRDVEMLLDADVDAVVIDTAHGHSEFVLDVVKEAVTSFGEKVDIVAGNVATYEGARDLLSLGIAGVKVGVGPGSICTTRVVSGVGVPQFTAVMEARRALMGSDVPLISDGGVRYSGDIAKAISAGADTCMIGNLFAGTDEAPGESTILGGRRYKVYRGMGSMGAMEQGSSGRYFQEEATKYVPEGVEGIVPYRGPVQEVVFQLLGGLRASMGYVGARTLEELKERARFVRMTAAGVREAHPHSVIITREAPNYYEIDKQF
jgi:IMP dehydrogenase